jgi:nucleotidyltransferase substrate binding protein (TIGR01987 family)
MSETEDFTQADLFALRSCLRDFDLILARHPAEADDIAVRYSLIKTFELTFEMAIKTLTRFLLQKSTGGSEIQGYLFQDLIRRGDQEGLLRSGWPEWKIYRENRGRTVHAYREEAALAITSQLGEFSVETHALLNNIERRLEDHG